MKEMLLYFIFHSVQWGSKSMKGKLLKSKNIFVLYLSNWNKVGFLFVHKKRDSKSKQGICWANETNCINRVNE